jgi:hypothetical protein
MDELKIVSRYIAAAREAANEARFIIDPDGKTFRSVGFCATHTCNGIAGLCCLQHADLTYRLDGLLIATTALRVQSPITIMQKQQGLVVSLAPRESHSRFRKTEAVCSFSTLEMV